MTVKRLIHLIVLILTPTLARAANDYWYSNTATGTGNGLNSGGCTNTYAYSDVTNGWNQSTPQTAGNTLHICGTITGSANQTILTAINSGTSGNPITLKWESGAVLQAPYFQGSSTTPTCGITLANKSWWVINGGSNGVMQNTANGTGLANTADSCLIGVSGTSNVIVENLTLANVYVHTQYQTGATATGTGSVATITCSIALCGLSTSPASTKINISGCSVAGYNQQNTTITGGSGNSITYSNATTGAATGCVVSDNNGANSYGLFWVNSTNLAVTNNTIHDARWNIWFAYAAAGGVSGLTIINNTIYNGDHGIAGGGDANSATMTGTNLIQSNYIHGPSTIWDAYSDNLGNYAFHHDYIHIWATSFSSNVINGLIIDKNHFDGDNGLGTAWVNLESRSPTSSYHNGTVVSNNVFHNTAGTGTPPYGYISSGGQNEVFVNNTIEGYSNTISPSANQCLYMGASGTGETFENNICWNVGFGVAALQGVNTAYTVIDYNYYYLYNSFDWNGTGVNFATWQTDCACDVTGHTTATNSTSPNVATSPPWKPNVGSPVIGAGVNLTSLCSTTPQICVDINGVTRPSTGAWDMGAAQFSSIAGSPTGFQIIF